MFPPLPESDTVTSESPTRGWQPVTHDIPSGIGTLDGEGVERFVTLAALPLVDDTATEALVRAPGKTRPPRPYPPVTYHPSADLRLTDRTNDVLDDLLPFLKRQALWRFVPVSKVEIHGFVNPEDRSEELVVTQWVALSPQEALVYWDRLAHALRAWSNRLPRHPARVALDQIGIEIRWEKHVSSV
jgi:hypothetical protein